MDLDGVRALAVVLAIASGVWVGGIVTVAIVAASSSTTISAPDRVSLFRLFGRRFAVFMGVAALFVVFPALVLAVVEPIPLTASTLVLSLGLLLVTAIGTFQARRMSALRAAAVSGDGDPAWIRRSAAVALVLRSLIGIASLALLVMALLIAARG